MRHFLDLGMEEDYENIQFLLKYAPKYYNKIDCNISELKDGRVLQKLRRLKVARSVELKHYKPKQQGLMLKAFQSQKKNITKLEPNNFYDLKCFPQTSQFTLNIRSLKSWRSFVTSFHIRDLTLDFPILVYTKRLPNPKELKAVKCLDWRFWKHLAKLNLRTLSLQIANQFNGKLSSFFTQLNTLEPLLSSLESLKLFFNHVDIDECEPLNFNNIYRNTTCLQIHELRFPALQQVLDQLDKFEKLVSLSAIKTVTFDQDNQKTLSFQALKYLQTLSKLETIDLSLNLSSKQHFISFLESFSLPKSVNTVKLTFYETAWRALLPNLFELNPKAENIFETMRICGPFYQQWEGLSKLKALSLNFTEAENFPTPSLYFVSPLLENLTNLQSLYYANCYNFESGKKKALDLTYLLKKISHLKSSLTRLFVENFAISMRNIQIEDFENLALEELGLCGFVLGSSELQRLFSFFPRVRGEYESTRRFEIERLVIDKDDDFPLFLQILKTLPKINISITVDVRKISPIVFLQELGKELPSLRRNHLVTLNFANVEPLELDQLQELSMLLRKRKIFKNVMVLDKEEKEIFNYEVAMLEYAFAQELKPIFQEAIEVEDDRTNLANLANLEAHRNDDSFNQYINSFSLDDDDEDDDGEDEFDFDESSLSDDFDMIDEDF